MPYRSFDSDSLAAPSDYRLWLGRETIEVAMLEGRWPRPSSSFLDMLTAVRQESWRLCFSDPSLPGSATQESAHSWANDLLATA